MKELFEKMRELDAEIMRYCTDQCDNCPMLDYCDWGNHEDGKGHIDFTVDFTDAQIERFMDYARRIDEREGV